jgi:Sortase domain
VAGTAVISSKPSTDPKPSVFEPGSDWIVTLSDRKVLVEQSLSKPIFAVRTFTNRAVGLEVWIDDSLVGKVDQVGNRVFLTTRMPAVGALTVVQVRKPGVRSPLASASIVSAGPLTSYSVTIVPAPEGFRILLNIESAAVGVPIEDPIHTDLGGTGPIGAIPKSLTVASMVGAGKVIPWSDLRTVGTGKAKLPDDAIGWWNKSRKIGETGISLFVGHVGFRGKRPGVFAMLKTMKLGDEILVVDVNEKVSRYTVYRNEVAGKKPFLPASFFGQVTRSEIRLVTCEDSGPSEIIDGEFHWLRNRVVFARLS